MQKYDLTRVKVCDLRRKDTIEENHHHDYIGSEDHLEIFPYEGVNVPGENYQPQQ